MVLKLDVESENAATTVSLVRLQQTKSLGRESVAVVAASQMEQTYFMDLEPPERMGSEDVMSTC